MCDKSECRRELWYFHISRLLQIRIKVPLMVLFDTYNRPKVNPDSQIQTTVILLPSNQHENPAPTLPSVLLLPWSTPGCEPWPSVSVSLTYNSHILPQSRHWSKWPTVSDLDRHQRSPSSLSVPFTPLIKKALGLIAAFLGGGAVWVTSRYTASSYSLKTLHTTSWPINVHQQSIRYVCSASANSKSVP